MKEVIGKYMEQAKIGRKQVYKTWPYFHFFRTILSAWSTFSSVRPWEQGLLK